MRVGVLLDWSSSHHNLQMKTALRLPLVLLSHSQFNGKQQLFDITCRVNLYFPLLFHCKFSSQIPLKSLGYKIQQNVCACVWFEGIIDTSQHTYQFISIILKYLSTPVAQTYIRLLSQLLPSWQRHWLRLSLLSGAEKAVNLRFTQQKGGGGITLQCTASKGTSKQWWSTWETKPPAGQVLHRTKSTYLNSKVLSHSLCHTVCGNHNSVVSVSNYLLHTTFCPRMVICQWERAPSRPPILQTINTRILETIICIFRNSTGWVSLPELVAKIPQQHHTLTIMAFFSIRQEK